MGRGGDCDVLSNSILKFGAGAALFSFALFGQGCDRASGVTTTGGTAASKPAAPRWDDDAPPPETNPAKLLARAMIMQQADKVDKILREHPDLLEKDVNGERPLWVACAKGSLPMARSLVERGADVKALNRKHQGVLWPAVESDNIALVKYLIGKGADPKALQEDDETLLWAAASRDMATLLIAAGVDPKHKSALGDYAIHQACRHAHKDVVKVLLDSAVGVETPGRWGMRPLHSAASSLHGDPKALVLLLLERGANINARGYRGHTALHECALYNRHVMADLLLSRGAEVDLKDDDGRTPMDAALLAGKKERALMINLLIRHGAPGILIPVKGE
jgi:ankyrin repeat protein